MDVVGMYRGLTEEEAAPRGSGKWRFPRFVKTAVLAAFALAGCGDDGRCLLGGAVGADATRTRTRTRTGTDGDGGGCMDEAVGADFASTRTRTGRTSP